MINFALQIQLSIMTETTQSPDFIFETSWEVCHKVGGIYTVLSSRAKSLLDLFPDKLCFIGPDLNDDQAPFIEDKRLRPNWRKALAADGLKVRIGRWDIPGKPLVVLVDFTPLFAEKDAIYAAAWNAFGVDSLHAYGDYDESSMFSVAAGRVAASIVRHCLPADARVIYQAHEWMSGMGMLFLKQELPQVATIFTTHATSIGRSIAGNNKLLYKYFDGYNGDQMAAELNMEAKHSIEKQSAWRADCFTTVSTFTQRECTGLLDKTPDVVLPNGFEPDFVPQGAAFTAKRRAARQAIIKVVRALTGQAIPDDVLIVSTSGRNDFRCKGFDVYLEALARLNERFKAKTHDMAEVPNQTKVVALIEVPCWVLGPREDLKERLSAKGKKYAGSLHTPMITHDLHNLNEDRILCLIKQLGLYSRPEDPVKVLLVPCYLEGQDGIFNMPYYDLLTANDLCIYPSYYEPWGYTPLESCAFRTPCITTDLSGFGQWVNDLLGHTGTLADGVSVIHRDDDNYFQAVEDICRGIEKMIGATTRETTAMRKAAAAIAAKAEWKHFVSHYLTAYDVALRNAAQNKAEA